MAAETPHLLLTPQRLKRLKREQERQADRWLNFEDRVKNVLDSPERGFELALYYAITADEESGKQAIAWAQQHPCEQRQFALVRDWVGDPVQNGGRPLPNCSDGGPKSLKPVRDDFFMSIAFGNSPTTKPPNISAAEEMVLANPNELYALCEYLIAMRDNEHTDLREQASEFFLKLPTEFMLSRTPQAAQRPDWITHVAALALVALDPNLQSSQFLQSWAMEERQTIRDGPGLGYELLWADPYLPGVGYQNLDTWTYDEAGRLFARTDWSSQACWIAISPGAIKAEHCPDDWNKKPFAFGHLTLLPFSAGCVQIATMQNNAHVILWQLQPRESIAFNAEHGRTMQADDAGMLNVASNLTGKACVAKGAKH